jgi:hypothetical protein
VSVDVITAEVQALDRLDLEALRAEWRRRYGPPSRLRSAELLRRMLAWKIQADAFGDLTPDARRSLRRVQAPVRQAARLAPGTRVAREWKGVRHDVEVVEGGYRYAGDTYRSLSKIAGVITGTKWNGPRFFGLSQEIEG